MSHATPLPPGHDEASSWFPDDEVSARQPAKERTKSIPSIHGLRRPRVAVMTSGRYHDGRQRHSEAETTRTRAGATPVVGLALTRGRPSAADRRVQRHVRQLHRAWLSVANSKGFPLLKSVARRPRISNSRQTDRTNNQGSPPPGNHCRRRTRLSAYGSSSPIPGNRGHDHSCCTAGLA